MAIEAATDGIEQLFLVRDKKPYKYLPDDAPYLVDAPIGSEAFERITSSLVSGDRIVLHYLHPSVRRWLANFNTKATIEWVFWSSDFYYCMYLNYPHYQPLTATVVRGNAPQPLSRFKLLHWYRSYKAKRQQKQKQREFIQERDTVAKKISVFHHYIKEEHELVEQLIPMKARFNYFCYSQDIPFDEIYRLSKTLTTASSPLNPNETNLLVGNSGYPHANHIDCFEFLKDKTESVKIITPLSYGDKEYINHVIAAGKKMLGDKLITIMEFMTFEQYLVLLMSCNGMLIGLSTPKSIGNIFTLLILGKRVFISKDSMAYKFIERMGIKINTIEEFSTVLLMRPENPEVVAENTARIIEMHSFAQNYSYVANLIKMDKNVS